MRIIFFDLETTHRSSLGQIINYCFIVTDENYVVQDQLSNDVVVSRLQLPAPGAILANRTDMFEHQSRAKLSEREAMREISNFIWGVINSSDDGVVLTGYNSANFDVPYLRTSFYRNGLNPYFGGKLIYRDLLHYSQKLLVSDERFPRIRREGTDRLSLTLESITQELGLLEGEQTHHSDDDVLLTIELAKHYDREFGLSLASLYNPYEVADHHDTIKSEQRVVYSLYPNYAIDEPNRALKQPRILLDFDHRQSLWVDLEKFREFGSERALKWINANASAFFFGKGEVSEELVELGNKARKQFSKVNLGNYFSETECDIEEHIYRLDFDALKALELAIWSGNTKLLGKLSTKSKDLKEISMRHRLAHYKWGRSDRGDEQVEKELRKYALYRYGGKAKLSKFESDDFEPEYHATLQAELEEIDTLREGADAKQKKLLDSLYAFYLESDIVRVAGDNLIGQLANAETEPKVGNGG